uniref:Uncharacterized protein n=1 Tax=Arundo donax TaxID=35708 RepID=A0A0A9D1U1_ARUDO
MLLNKQSKSQNTQIVFSTNSNIRSTSNLVISFSWGIQSFLLKGLLCRFGLNE